MKVHRLTIAMVLAAAFPVLVTAQQNTYSLSANLANPRITLGDVGVLELKAIGGEPDIVPRSIDVPGLSITYTGSQFHQDQKVIQGQVAVTLTYTYYYTIQGTREGEFTIPPVSAKIRGETVSTTPVKVNIVRSNTASVNPTSSKFANLVIPETNLYVNQIFPIDATIYVAGRNAINGVNGAELKHESFVIKRFEQVDLGAVEIRGAVYSTAKLPTTLFALKAGDHRLGPATFNVKLYENNSRFAVPSFFTQLRLRPIQSETIRVNILPLPSGAPASFSGGVGAFEMESEASPLKLKVGDPISLEFTVTGTGNLQTLGAPVAASLDPEVWKIYEAKKDLQVESDGFNQGRSVFSQVVIPLKEVDELPAFELSYFDPKVGQYIKRRTIPTPITVAPDNSPLPDPVGLPSPTGLNNFPAATAAAPMARFPDILHIRKGMPRWRTYSATGRPAIFLGVTNVVLGAAFFGLLGLGVVRKIRERREALNSEPRAATFKETVSRIRPGTDREDFYHSAHEAFSLWETENTDAPADILTIVADMKSKCETALYSNLSDDNPRPISTAEANEFLKVLKKLPTS